VTPGPPTATDRAESTSHQLVIGVRVDSDGDVIAFLHEIDVPVFRDEFEADFRGDLGESGCDPAHRDMAEHQRRADCAAVRVNEPPRNGRLLPVKRAGTLHCGGQRFESPPVHQEVLVIDGGFQGPEISRPHKGLAGSERGLRRPFGGSVRLSRLDAAASLWPQNSVSQIRAGGPREATSVRDLNAAPISE
jgi:hypothetical protein